MHRLLGALEKRQDAKAARDRALLRLAFDLGLRRGELASLDLEHLDLGEGTLAVLGKGQEGRELLTLPPETVAVLHAWLEQRGRKPGPLFFNFDRAGKGQRLTSTSIYRIVRELGEQIQVRARPLGCATQRSRRCWISPRATFGPLLVSAGMPTSEPSPSRAGSPNGPAHGWLAQVDPNTSNGGGLTVFAVCAS
jgi:integrase